MISVFLLGTAIEYNEGRKMNRPVIGLALSSGGSRGSAHAGVLKVLTRHDIPIDIITGTSMGAMVGGAFAAGISAKEIEEQWLRTDWKRMLRSFMPTFPRFGWSSGEGVRMMLHGLLGDTSVEELSIKFAAVATDIETGEEVIIREGPLVDAIRASCSIPGLFIPVKWEVQPTGRFLVDGSLSNPLPVDVARQLGAETVIAVDVASSPVEFPNSLSREGTRKVKQLAPGPIQVLTLSSIIFQQTVLSLKLKLDSPDVLIKPPLAQNPPSYRRAEPGIKAGELATEEVIDKIKELVGSRRRR